MGAGNSIGLHKMIDKNSELFALRYACLKALDLLTDGDAEPADADAVIAIIEKALTWGTKS
jgi:hypothetical protein